MKKRVLFVCLGNICRSPAAEAIFTHYMKETKDDTLEFQSAGTSGLHAGEKADERMISALQEQGIVCSSVSRQLTNSDFELFDYIVAMDDSNYQNLLRQNVIKEYEHKILKMQDFFADEYKSYTEVPDPYYGEKKDFVFVIDILKSSIENFIKYSKN